MSRQVDISNYYPNAVKNIKDFVELYKAENPELETLNTNLVKSLDNQFILYTDKDGIKRYEMLVGINANVKNDLEERRVNVLNKWNNELPYTVNRLKERLYALIGNDYKIEVRYGIYTLYVTVYEKTTAVLNAVYNVVKDMTPINMIIIFAGAYSIEFFKNIVTESDFRLISDFYPRYNLEQLFLNGVSEIDGKYVLNGYKADIFVEFYPTSLKIENFISTKKEISNLLILKNDYFATVDEKSNELVFVSEILKSINICEKMNINNYILTDFKIDNINKCISCYDANTLQDGTILISFHTDVSKSMENKVHLSYEINSTTEIENSLTVEKHLWFMNGDFELNGEKPLDPEIIYY